MTGRSTLVVGASRGLGRGIAIAFADAGDSVVAVGRDVVELEELASTTGITPEAADASDGSTATRLMATYRPSLIVVVAGARPHSLPLQEHTWETFAVNWNADVKIAFEWLGASLRAPLEPGSDVVVISSGAAVQGSPLSGGYAGAKATQRFITRYAQDESTRAGLGITFTAVLPQITPATDLGLPAVQAYAERAGISVEAYLSQFGALLTPAIAGTELVKLVADPTHPAELLLTGAGLRPLPA